MSKYGFIIVASWLSLSSIFASNYNSIVNLPGGGTVAPTTSVNLPLTGLVPSASYTIICYIDSTDPFVIVRFSANFGGAGGAVSFYNLNGINVTQGRLDIGQNILNISGYFANPSASSIVFTNLDQSISFNVYNCFAIANMDNFN
jgi:hypothetical protein